MRIDSIRLAFIIICLFIILMLSLLSVYMFKKDNKYKLCIVRPINVYLFAIAVYCLFLVSETHKFAVFFDSLYFASTDWLAMFMLFFAIGYTEVAVEYEKKMFVLFSIICSIDTVGLFINNFTFHMFELVQMTSSFGITFWGNAFRPLHYVHLGFCYVMVFLTFLYLGISLYKAPGLCKTKYIGILIAYAVVIAANCV